MWSIWVHWEQKIQWVPQDSKVDITVDHPMLHPSQMAFFQTYKGSEKMQNLFLLQVQYSRVNLAPPPPPLPVNIPTIDLNKI